MNPTRDGVRYVITGGAGAKLGEQPVTGDFNHFLLVTAPRDRAATLAVIPTGALLPDDVVTTEQSQYHNRLLRQFRVAPLAIEDKPATRKLSFTVTNPFPKPIAGTVSFVGAGLTASPASRTFALPVGGAAKLEFEVTAHPAQLKGPVPCRVAYAVGGGRTNVCLNKLTVTTIIRAPQKPENGAAWGEIGRAPLVLNRKDQLWGEAERWRGPETLSARGLGGVRSGAPVSGGEGGGGDLHPHAAARRLGERRFGGGLHRRPRAGRGGEGRGHFRGNAVRLRTGSRGAARAGVRPGPA